MPVSIMSPTPGARTPRRVQWAGTDHVHEPEPVSPHALDEMAQDVSTLLFIFNRFLH
jgi:hypothetical protein